jgi:hypothetical protein
MWGKAMSELRRSKRKEDFKYFLMPPTTHPSGFKTTEREIYLPNSMQIENAARRAKDKYEPLAKSNPIGKLALGLALIIAAIYGAFLFWSSGQ